MAGDDDEIFMIRSFNNVMPKPTEQHLIVRSDTAYATNNKRLLDIFVLLKLTTDTQRSIRAASLRQQSYFSAFVGRSGCD